MSVDCLLGLMVLVGGAMSLVFNGLDTMTLRVPRLLAVRTFSLCVWYILLV